jgi:hypothetical protein
MSDKITYRGPGIIGWIVVAITALFAGSKVFGVGIAATWSWWAVLTPLLLWLGWIFFWLFIALIGLIVAAAIAARN